MPILRELGYIEQRATRGRTGRYVWHRTQANRDLRAALGIPEGVEHHAPMAQRHSAPSNREACLRGM